LHTARLYLTTITPESILNMVSEMETQARLLASADVDVIVLGATAPSFLKGLGYDREIVQKLEAVSGRRATTTSTALVDALRHIGARRIVLGSAYDAKVNAIAKGFLEASGFEVLAARGLDLLDNLVVGRLDPDTAYDVALEVDRSDADAIVLACTNWRTMDVIERIERRTGKPVISTSQASIWAALRAIGGAYCIEGYGGLLQDVRAAPRQRAA
jgi:maleate cis-trans isomerase